MSKVIQDTVDSLIDSIKSTNETWCKCAGIEDPVKYYFRQLSINQIKIMEALAILLIETRRLK